MAAGNSTLMFRGLKTGRPLVVYTYEAGSDAALARLPLDGTAIATSASPKTIVFDEDMVLTDFIARSTTSGAVRFVAGGVPTMGILNMAAHGGTNSGRPRPMYKLRAGVSYELQVLQALDA